MRPDPISPERPFAGRKLHFTGIGGAGMSGLAHLALALGAEVTGSDRSRSPYWDLLESDGIEVSLGHDRRNVPEGAQVVVSTAIAADNPEILACLDSGGLTIKRGELLAEIAAQKRSIAVAGAHGKTTTSGMIAHCLVEMSADPSFAIGGRLRSSGGANARSGRGEWIVVEADESDGSFLLLAPDVAVVTNVELDHHAYYSSLSDLRIAVGRFLAAGPLLGKCVVPDRPELLHLVPKGRDTATFDIVDDSSPTSARNRGTTFAAADISHRNLGSEFSLLRTGDEIARVTLGIPGRHNVLNALAALAALSQAGFDPSEAAPWLASYRGASRRFEPKGTVAGVTVFDDYAHHPTEVRAAIETALRITDRKLFVVFQPHLYSRTLYLAGEFGSALALADEILVLDVYPAREEPVGVLSGVSGKLVAEAAADRAGGRRVWWTPTPREAVAALESRLRPGDTVLTVGAGDVFEIAEATVDSTALRDGLGADS